MKKILALALCAVMVFGLAACGTQAADPSTAPEASGNGNEAVYTLKLGYSTSGVPHSHVVRRFQGKSRRTDGRRRRR